MAKRYVRIKNRKIRADRLLVGVLALVVLAAALILIVSSCRRGGDPAKAVDAGWYRDDLGRIEDDRALTRGMAAFEKRTGVTPYLTLLDGVDPEELDLFCEDQYDALFADGGHLLVVYDEWGEDGYYLAARAGESSSLSREDVSKLLACLEDAYADPANETYAQAFGAGFRQGAKAVSPGASGVGLLLLLGLFLLLLSAVLVFTLRRRTREAARRRKPYLEDED